MEELKERYRKMALAYKDTPENRERVLLPFVLELTKIPMKERHKLVKLIDELRWIRKKTIAGESWTSCSNDRRAFLNATELVCINGRDTLAFGSDAELLFAVLKTYCPPEFVRLLTDKLDVPEKVIYNIGYTQLLRLFELGHISRLSPATLAFHLGLCIWSNVVMGNSNKYRVVYSNKPLFEHEITMREHVWHLFSYDSPVAYNDQNAREAFAKGETESDQSVAAALIGGMKESTIDRSRLLDESAGALTRGLSKDVTGWAMAIFEECEPTADELVERQEALLPALASGQTKVVTAIIKQLKRIADDDRFAHTDFVAHTTPLLYNAPKNQTTALVAVYELIAKRHSDVRHDCCEAVAQLFLRSDEALQARAAKFIMQHCDAPETVIAPYEGELLMKTRELLQPVLSSTAAETPADDYADEQQEQPVSFVPVDVPTTKDDFIFLFSRLLDTSDPCEIFVALASAVEWFPLLNDADFASFDSLISRALPLANNSDPSFDYHKSLIATFIIEMCMLNERRNRPQANVTERVLSVFKIKSPTFRGVKVGLLKNMKRVLRPDCLEPFRLLLLDMLHRMRDGDPLPVLSTPTHRPAFVSASALAERLSQYRKAGRKPFTIDLQLAISRCREIDGTPDLSQLDGEELRLMRFLLGHDAEPQPPFTLHGAWVQAGLVRNPDAAWPQFNGFNCRTMPDSCLNGDHNVRIVDSKPGCYSRILLTPAHPERPSIYVKSLLQEWMSISTRWQWGDSGYMPIVLSYYPVRPEPLIAAIVKDYINFTQPRSEEKRVPALALQMLADSGCEMRDITLLFLASSLVYGDVTVRTLAAELWVSRTLDDRRLAEHLAWLLTSGLFPPKRLTDTIYNNMYRRARATDIRLRTLLGRLTELTADVNKNGMKRLNELCKEVRTACGERK